LDHPLADTENVRDIALRILKTVLALGALGYLVVVVEPSAIVAALSNAHWPWIAAALALLPVNLVVDGIVWRRLLRPVAPGVTPQQLGGAILSGFALGFVTPARAGEFVGRSLYIPDADPWSVSLTVFVQRLIDTAINVGAGVGVLAITLYSGVLSTTWPWVALLTVSAAFLGLLVGFLMTPALAARLVRRLLPNRPALHQRVDILQAYQPRAVLRTVGWALLRYGVFCAQFLLLLYAFAPALGLIEAISAIALTFFVKFMVPSVTIMDLGIQEGAAVFFLSLFGAAQAIAFNAALLLFIINIVVPTAAGVPFVWKLDLRRDTAPAPSTSPASAD
jgi:uncharacterized membrane protein YbhN (UPF0104 family)